MAKEPIAINLTEQEIQDRVNAMNAAAGTESNEPQTAKIKKKVKDRVKKEQAEKINTPPNNRQGFTSHEILKALERNEDGDADLFYEIHKGRMLYDHAAKQWHVWEKHYWKEDLTEHALDAIDAIVSEYQKEYARQSEQELEAQKRNDGESKKHHERLRKELAKRIIALLSVGRKKNVLTLAATGARLGVSGNDFWDKNTMFLGCPNGVVDMVTGGFGNGLPEDYIKSITKAHWTGIDTPCPIWERFLSEIFDNDADLISYFQRLLGYSITGRSNEHIFPVLHGRGRNGKGTVLETLKYVLGDIAGSIPSETLLDQKQHAAGGAATPDLMLLRGRRLVWASETSEGRRFNIGKVKWLCGGDTIQGRHLFGKMSSFNPTFTLFLLTNHKPKADPSDYAFWKRVHLIPFELSFTDKPEKDYERKVDKELPEKLKKESSGILAWLVRGCLDWQGIGLQPPDRVKAATDEYRKSEDTIGQWIDECCEIGLLAGGKETKSSELFTAYETHCKSNSIYSVNSKAFGVYLTETRELKKRKLKDGWYYTGIILKG